MALQAPAAGPATRRRVALVAGDPNGIGPEIALKAAARFQCRTQKWTSRHLAST